MVGTLTVFGMLDLALHLLAAALIRDFADTVATLLEKTKLRKIHCLIGLITW